MKPMHTKRVQTKLASNQCSPIEINRAGNVNTWVLEPNNKQDLQGRGGGFQGPGLVYPSLISNRDRTLFPLVIRDPVEHNKQENLPLQAL